MADTESPMQTVKVRLFEASSLMDMLKKAYEGESYIENVALVTDRLINEALDVIEKMEVANG